MTLAFILTMPSNNSWNGRWTGDDKLYARVQSVKKLAHEIEGHHYYNFGDGWLACVEVRQVDKSEAARLRRKSVGFCGYDWMISSLLSHGQITTKTELAKAGEANG